MSMMITLPDDVLAALAMPTARQMALFGDVARGARADQAKGLSGLFFPTPEQLMQVFAGEVRAGRVDAAATVAMTEELTHVFAELSRQTYPEHQFASGLVDVDTSVAVGMDSYVWYELTGTGHVIRMTPETAEQLPIVGIGMKKRRGDIARFGNGYKITARDQEQQPHISINLNREFAELAMEAHAARRDRVWSWGEPDSNLAGLLNHPNLPIVHAAAGGSGSTYWSNKTGDEIIADIRQLIRFMATNTLEVVKPNEIWMAPAQMALLSSVKMGPLGSDPTVLEYAERVFRGVTFREVNRLAVSQSHGNLAEDAVFAIRRDRRRVVAILTEPTRQHAPFPQLLGAYLVAITSGYGGMKISDPFYTARLDGVGDGQG